MILSSIPVIEYLIDNGIDAYPIGKHTGECKKEFVVVKQDSTTSQLGSRDLGYTIIDIILYVPIASYSKLESYGNKVINILKELKWLRSVGQWTPPIVDDEKKAYTFSIKYQVYKRMEV